MDEVKALKARQDLKLTELGQLARRGSLEINEGDTQVDLVQRDLEKTAANQYNAMLKLHDRVRMLERVLSL